MPCFVKILVPDATQSASPLSCAHELRLVLRPRAVADTETLDVAQLRFTGQQGAGDPAVCLLGGSSAIHFVGHLPALGVQRLQAVGGLEADAQ